jgi:hypothetical protein
MRPLLDERKENCGLREAVENGFPCERRVITGLKAGVNEKLQLGDCASYYERPSIAGISCDVGEKRAFA